MCQPIECESIRLSQSWARPCRISKDKDSSSSVEILEKLEKSGIDLKRFVYEIGVYIYKLFLHRLAHRHGLRTPREEMAYTARPNFNPNPKFLGMAAAHFVCHIGPIFQISLIYAFIGCPQSVNDYMIYEIILSMFVFNLRFLLHILKSQK